MPTAQSKDGTPIYYDVEGSGPPVMLYHGLGVSGEFWRIYGYVAALRDAFRVILIDDRAHGASGKPHDPTDLVMERRVEDVTAVLDAIEVEQVHFVGYSMGAIIGYGVARLAPQRLASLVIGGSSPFPPTDPEISTALAEKFREVGGPLAVAALESELGSIPDEARRIALDNDADAVAAAVLAMRDFPHPGDSLSEIDLPFLGYCGSDDALRERTERAAAQVPDGTFVTLDGLNHLEAFAHVDTVLAHVRPFLEEAAAT